MQIVINGNITGGWIKVGGFTQEFHFYGGFNKYKYVHMVSKANGLGIENRWFNEGMLGFGWLFKYCLKHVVVNNGGNFERF